MIYGSVCSGIEAATVAWHTLGWKPSFFSEIDKFPRQVLAHHYPDVPLHGDFTTIQKGQYEPIELLVGGTPCQSFSVAGLRAGLADPRGNLMLEFGALADRLQPRWLLWENVPGVLSSNGGRDFGSFLAMLGELGYGFAYRVLDAQYFGVPQRRRRVFVVGHLGDWRSAAAVLFERESLSWNPPPSRRAGQKIATAFAASVRDGGWCASNPNVGYSKEIIETGVSNAKTETALIPRTTCSGKDTFGTLMANCGTKQWLGNQEALSGDYHVFALAGNTIGRQPDNGGNGDGFSEDISYTLTKTDVHAVACFKGGQGSKAGGIGYSEHVSPTLSSAGGSNRTPVVLTQGGEGYGVAKNMQVRRLTPIECERLQGFPDHYTNVPGASDSGRYKALGNSMAVPVMRWIGERIEMVSQNCIEESA